MKLRFRTRLIVINTLIAIGIIAMIGFFIIQGIVNYSINNSISNLLTTSNEVNILINQSILSTQTTGKDRIIYESGAVFYAQKASEIYSIPVILYDTEYNILGTTFEYSDNKSYTSYVSQVIESETSSYIYTTIDNTNYLILFSPIRINGETVGISALFSSTSQIDRLVSKTILLFFYSSIGAAAISVLVYMSAYGKMFRPINQLVEYSKQAAQGDLIKFPEIAYKGEDEIKDLIESNASMLKQIKEKIEESEFEKDKLAAVIASMQDAVIAVNLSHEILTSNKKLNEYFPKDSNYFDVIPHIDETIIKVLDTREDISYEFQFGEKHYFMSATLIAPQKDDDGVLIVIRDITALKKIEEEQNKFISSVSHELRTPLTTINGYVDLLERRGTDDEALTKKALVTTRKETQRLLRLVDDLLNINRYHSTDFEFIFTNIDPNMLIEDAVAEMNFKAGQIGIEVIYQPVDLPEIKGDFDRLKQVLINVIDNAIKYSNTNDIVKVTATYDEHFLEITVRDFGEGIPEEMKEKIFDTFYRVEEDRSRLRGGFGLGLSIVKHIVERHDGTVSVESIMNEGTVISVKLPLIENKGGLTHEETDH